MPEVKVNFVSKPLADRNKRGFFFFGRVFAVTVALAAIVASAVSFKNASKGRTETSVLDVIPVFSQIRSFIHAADRPTDIDDGRTNILFLGVGGPGHEGPQLADTMLFASLDRKDHRVGVISIPRDLAVDIPGYGEHKINHANAYGEDRAYGDGPKLASQVVEDVFGRHVHYYLRVDFQAFVDVIDQLGGVDVHVDRRFTDAQFPDDNYGVQTVTFESGKQHMDGKTALMFARSRHGNNGEGSDFARSARQQKIIAAVKEKMFSSSTLMSPTVIGGIMKTLKHHVNTNLTPVDIFTLAKEFRGVDTNEVRTAVLIPGEKGPLYETVANGAYLILPKADNWSDLHTMANNIFDLPVAAGAPEQTVVARVEVQNGTSQTGLARQVAGQIAKNGFVVAKIGNAAERGYEKTVIYDLSKGKKSGDLEKLRRLLDADVKQPKEGWTFTTTLEPTKDTVIADEEQFASDLDFLVIIGAGNQFGIR